MLALWRADALQYSTYRPGSGWTPPATVEPLASVVVSTALDAGHALLVTRDQSRYQSRVFDEASGTRAGARRAMPDVTTVFLPTRWAFPAAVALGDGGDAAIAFQDPAWRAYLSVARPTG